MIGVARLKKRVGALGFSQVFIRLIKKLFWKFGISKFRRVLQRSQASIHDNYPIALPFPFAVSTGAPSVAVICHMFYTDLLDEILRYLENIPFAFDLFFTTDTQEKKDCIEQRLKNWNKGALEVRLAKNSGRDIAPKLIACQDVYACYEFFLHIHTKKSHHIKSGDKWRRYLFDTLLGSQAIVKSIFELFRLDKKLGIISPQHLNETRAWIHWAGSLSIAKVFLPTYLKMTFPEHIDFPSGSMFWARSLALKPLLDLNLQIADFGREQGQVDETLAHLIERCYFLASQKIGYKWVKIVDVAQEEVLEGAIVLKNPHELLNFIKTELGSYKLCSEVIV